MVADGDRRRPCAPTKSKYNSTPPYASITAQSYDRGIVEVLVVDGGSTDDTTEQRIDVPAGRRGVLDNPDRIQAAALNVALGATTGWRCSSVSTATVSSPKITSSGASKPFRATGAALVGGDATHRRGPAATGIGRP